MCPPSIVLWVVYVLSEVIWTVLFDEHVASKGRVGCGVEIQARSLSGGREVILRSCMVAMGKWVVFIIGVGDGELMGHM